MLVLVRSTIISIKSQGIKFIEYWGLLALQKWTILHIIQLSSRRGFGVQISSMMAYILVLVGGGTAQDADVVGSSHLTCSISIPKRDIIKAFCQGVNGTSNIPPPVMASIFPRAIR